MSPPARPGVAKVALLDQTVVETLNVEGVGLDELVARSDYIISKSNTYFPSKC